MKLVANEIFGGSKKEDGNERFYGYHYDTAHDSFIQGVNWLAERLKTNDDERGSKTAILKT